MRLKGKLIKHLVARGSKSEHDAVLIKTADGEFRLRRVEGNPFYDPVLESLVGKYVTLEGEWRDDIFQALSVVEAPDSKQQG